MRFKSRRNASGQVFAVTGTNTVSFGIAASDGALDGLLGFAVERTDEASGRTRWLPGFKVFRSVVPQPDPEVRVSTFDHPVQSLSWDDFTVAAGATYRYRFQPVKGSPGALARPGPAMSVRVRTEALVDGTHDVFFNRGVASSQAYVREFGTAPIAALAPADRARALAWLSRDLDEAMIRFVDACEPGDTLLGCFYEFRYLPVAQRLRAALDRGVVVRLVYDGKQDENGFPGRDNEATRVEAGIPEGARTLRLARPSAIPHNKFMVRLVGGQQPADVWTGSTNLSLGGISGQTNVGHWVRDPAVAARFRDYWELLSGDPGGRKDDPQATKTAKNKALKAAVEALSPVPADLGDLPTGTTVAFSPRATLDLLDDYAALLDTSDRQACLTLAFGVDPRFKALLADNTAQDALVFLLLEKRDRAKPSATEPAAAVRLNASQNVYQAWGSFLRDPVYQWARETNAGNLGLNHHVSYIHSKFMLVDPLGPEPVVITGSANFSKPSTNENDENMLLVKGDRRVADIYLTEFNRIFNHYYFRSVTEAQGGATPAAAAAATDASLFLAENADWQAKYAPGSFKAKRLALWASMSGFTRL